MKKVFILISTISICSHAISMDLQTMQYYRECLKDAPLGFLPNQGNPDTREALRKEAQTKYDLLTQGWKSNCASPLKPFEQCTWNDIEAAYNGDTSRLVNPYIPTPAKY